MTPKQLADGVRRLRQDPIVCEITERIKEDMHRVFFDPSSTEEELKAARTMVLAFEEIERQLHTILMDEAVLDKREGDQERE